MSLYPDWALPKIKEHNDEVRTEEACEALWWSELDKRSAAARQAAREEAIGKARARVRAQCSSPDGLRECRQCVGCLRLRSARWVARARHEWFSHDKVWWITLTYAGEAEIGYTEVQKWLKRLRKTCSLRFVVSEERGEKRGRLHFHVLLFCSKAVTKRMLQAQWSFGFSKVVLARTIGAVRYMSKYLAKGVGDEVGRIRASVGFGNGLLAIKRAGRFDLLEAIDHWLFTVTAPKPAFLTCGAKRSRFLIAEWWLQPPF